jgi:hypothetical protein
MSAIIFLLLLLLLLLLGQVVKVVLDDGSGSSKPYVARVVGTDAMHDLAVLQVS